MSHRCYLCGNAAELSSEHIIPQCLGGILSAEIFCVACNSACGHAIDVELARQFGRYATLLQIGRERGQNQPFTIVSEDTGLRLRFDGEIIRREKPEVRIDKDASGRVKEVEVIARSEKELKSIFEGIAQKHNIDPTLGAFDCVEHPAPEASHEFVLDNPTIHRAIAKIAYGFACIKLPANLILAEPFNRIREFILGREAPPLVSSNYAHGDFMVDNIRPLHKIHLSLNRKDRLAIGYVALFGTFRYTVLLSESVDGEVEWPAIDYTYDPVTQHEVPANLRFQAPRLTKEDVVHPKQSRKQVLDSLQKGQQVLVEYSPALQEISVEAISGKA